MIQEIFTIHDSKAEAFLPPFFQPNKSVAQRMFFNAVADTATDFSRFPEDYTLFSIGTFDNIAGVIEHHEKISLGNGVEFVRISVDQVIKGEQI